MLTGTIVIFTFLMLTAALADTNQFGMVPIPDGRIVGGVSADITQYPHQISMRYNGKHRCGGSIYSENIIISAAHCVKGVDATRLSIVAGITLLSEKGIELPVEKYLIHQNYNSINNDNDVAILWLSGKFPLSNSIQPISLARERPELGTPVTVTGWGTLVEGGSIPDQLQEVDVNIVNNSACKSAYSFLLTSRMLCAGVEAGGKDACQGDSGGPLVVDNTLLGIVSWGMGCAREGYPGVYASVPDLRKWILQAIESKTN